MDPTGSDPEADLTGLEEALARLRPSPIPLNRDRLLFEAGRAAGRAERRGWARGIAAAFALAALGLGGLLARERGERRDLEVKIASPDARAPSSPRVPPATVDDRPTGPAGPNSYLALTRHLATGGFDTMPIERPAVTPPRVPFGPTEPPAMLRSRAIGELLEL